jgi:hypothetical protein
VPTLIDQNDGVRIGASINAAIAVATAESLVQFIRGYHFQRPGLAWSTVAKSLVLPTVRALRVVWLNLIFT